MKFAMLFFALTICACADTARKTNNVSVGMTKAEVRSTLGDPDESRGVAGTEYMVYKLRKAPSSGAQTGCAAAGIATYGLVYLFKSCQYLDDDYFVMLRDGKVYSYGKVGDFNSTKDPTVNINQTITTQQAAPGVVPPAGTATSPAAPPVLGGP